MVGKLVLNLDIPFSQVFYAFNHGQGRQDGEISSIKKLISSGVRKFARVTDVSKLYQYLIKNAQFPKSENMDRRFFYIVNSEDVTRQKKAT